MVSIFADNKYLVRSLWLQEMGGTPGSGPFSENLGAQADSGFGIEDPVLLKLRKSL